MASPSPPVVLVTGCSDGGIGAGLCIELDKRGAKVYATTRRLETMSSLPASIQKLRLDVNDEKSIKDCVDEIISNDGRIDCLINNAGGGMSKGPIVESSIDEMKQMFEMNVFGLLRVTQAVAPHMMKARKGRIINMGSLAGELALPFETPYCASKAAVKFFTDGLRDELYPFGIEVTLVKFGAVASNFRENRDQAGSHGDRVKDTMYGPWLPALRADGPAVDPNRWSVEQFCTHVVNKIWPFDRPAPRDVWGATNQWIVWFLNGLPYSVRDFMALRMFKLNTKLLAN
ncbi:oxidoreductase [Hyaloraphidium curvatum]|nr:oxidoreductase [Hyaloraphidium curvatum]